MLRWKVHRAVFLNEAVYFDPYYYNCSHWVSVLVSLQESNYIKRKFNIKRICADIPLYFTENCLRIAGGVAAGFGFCECKLAPDVVAPFNEAGVDDVDFEPPMQRGNVCDLLTLRFAGRLFVIINFLPDADFVHIKRKR